MTATVVPIRPLYLAIFAQLSTVPNATGFVGEAVDVPLLPSGDGRVAPYWVLHLDAGDPAVEPTLDDTAVDLGWGFQVTAAAGVVEDLTALVDRINAVLYRWTPVVEGLVCGPIKTPPGYRAPGLLDLDVTPHRPYMPLQFQTTVTTT